MSGVISSKCNAPSQARTFRVFPRIATSFLCVVALLHFSHVTVCGADTAGGEGISKSECARCRGPMGDGTKKTARPLVGDKSPAQLTAFIRRTMPDDDPGSCTADQSQKVA